MQKVLVIGAGMAACKFAMALAQKSNDYQITLISNEAVPSYNRIMLSPLLAKETTFDDIVLHSDKQFQQQKINRVSNCQVEVIDSKNQCVISTTGQRLPYDKLVIATGSKPFLLPLEHSQHPSVLGFRTLNDVKNIQALCQKPNSHCVVVGAGLLGLEAASALAKQGVHTTVVHRGDHILSQQLNPAAAQCLQQDLAKMGVQFQLQANVKKIVLGKDKQLAAVELDNNTQLKADCLVMAVGIVPEIALAKKAGLKTGKGICVNAQMQTSEANIFAIGECTEFEKNCFGLVAPVYQQALVLANFLAGEKQQNFTVQQHATKLKVSGVDVFSAGCIREKPSYNFIEYHNPLANHYKRLTLEQGRIVGIVLYGDVVDGPWYFELMQQHTDVSPWRQMLVFGKAYSLLQEVA